MSPAPLHIILLLLFHLLCPSYSLSKAYFADEEQEGPYREEKAIGPPVESNEIEVFYNISHSSGYFPRVCPTLSHPMNSEVTCRNEGSFKRCEQKCDPDTKLPSGDDSITLFCDNEKGYWEPQRNFQDCESAVQNCPELSSYMNSKVTCRKIGTQRSCTQTCLPGYVLPDGTNAETLTCDILSSPWWEPRGDFRNCQVASKKCPSVRHPENGKVSCEPSGNYRICRLECMPGYKLRDGETKATITCQNTKGYWEPYSDFPDCEEASTNGCPNLRQPLKSKVTCRNRGAYRECEQTCSPGYVLPTGSTSTTLICRYSDGYWQPDGEFQDCQILSYECPELRIPAKATLDCRDHGTYKICEQTCFDGYMLPVGTPRTKFICQHANGYWEPDDNVQDCIVSPETCPELPLPGNSRLDCSNHDTFKICIQKCKPGYELPGGDTDDSRTCQHLTGVWEPVKNFQDCQAKCNPTCKNGATCIEGNKCVCAKGFRGDRCDYSNDLCSTNDFGYDVIHVCDHGTEYTECVVTCPTGKILISSTSGVYRCSVDGKWNPTSPPYCVKENVCNSPSPPRNGYVLCKTVDNDLVCTAYCFEGYQFPNGEDRTINKCSYMNSGWTPSPSFPDCEIPATSPPIVTVPPTETVTLPPPTLCKEPLGLRNGKIAEYQLSASSTVGTVYIPSEGRLGSETAWSAGILDTKQWLQVDFITPQDITGVITRGKRTLFEWVTSFKVTYSDDGEVFKTLGDDDGNPKEFPGNSDRETAVTHMFPKTIRARYLRINPTKWHGWISLQIEVLGCEYTLKTCHKPMGLISKRIADFQLSASSRWLLHEAEQGRISSGHGWSALVLNDKQYFQVDLLEPMVVTAIVTKGNKLYYQWTKNYEVWYSNDSMKFTKIEDALGIPKKFVANHDMNSGKINFLPKEIKARFIRLHPLQYYGWITMRVELLGCYERKECREPVSLENLPESQITASSVYPGFPPKHARMSSSPNSWQPLVSNLEQFILIDLKKPRKISGVVTKGRKDILYWVKKYKVLTSLDGNKWDRVTDSSGSPEVFPGNVENISPVINIFDAPVTTRYVKIYPLQWQGWISMRLELIGCD